jgi:hypothetical protein
MHVFPAATGKPQAPISCRVLTLAAFVREPVTVRFGCTHSGNALSGQRWEAIIGNEFTLTVYSF